MSVHKRPDKNVRRERAYRRLGTRTPKCAQCPESDPLALTGTHPDIVCYEDGALAQGRSRRTTSPDSTTPPISSASRRTITAS